MSRGQVDVRDMLVQQLQNQGLGGIVPHLVSLPVLPPDIVSLDFVDLTCSITSAGVVTDPAGVQLGTNYLTDWYGMIGWMSNPGTDPELPALVQCELSEYGRSGRLFSTKFRMAYLCRTTGPGNPIMWPRSTYVFTKGSQVQATFSVLSGYSSNASETKTFGVGLICGKFAGSRD